MSKEESNIRRTWPGCASFGVNASCTTVDVSLSKTYPNTMVCLTRRLTTPFRLEETLSMKPSFVKRALCRGERIDRYRYKVQTKGAKGNRKVASNVTTNKPCYGRRYTLRFSPFHSWLTALLIWGDVLTTAIGCCLPYSSILGLLRYFSLDP